MKGRLYLFVVFFVFYELKNGVESANLNHPRVLLPIFQEKAINFTLEVVDGNCFKWCVWRHSRRRLYNLKANFPPKNLSLLKKTFHYPSFKGLRRVRI